MSNIKLLREQLVDKEARLVEIRSLTDKEKRARTEDEATEWKSLTKEIQTIEEQIVEDEAFDSRSAERAKKQEKEKRDKDAAYVAGEPVGESETRDLNKTGKSYSILRALRRAREGRALEGAEKELFEEAEGEVKESGQELRGNVAIPSKFVVMQKRDLTVAVEGTNVVAESTEALIPILAPRPTVVALGARTLTGLVGDLKFPRHTVASTLEWEGETDANAETTPEFDKVNMSPNRVGGFTDISQQLLRQSSFSMEKFVRDDLNRVLGLEIDETAIAGTGTGDQPLGILNTVGIGDVAIDTDGGALTWAKVLELASDVDTANALIGDLSFLTTPGVKYHAMGTPRQASGVEGNFIMSLNNSLIGYNVTTSTQVPSNLTKGSGTNLHAMIFGNWNDWMIGQWGGIDLLIDPYTQAINGLLRIVINAYYDMKTRHPEGFSAIQDIDPTA